MSNTTPHLHILVPAEGGCLEALASHSLASVRMRSTLAARAATSLGWQVSVGERPSTVPDVLLVGKIGAHQISERSSAWLAAIKKSRASQKVVCLDYTDNHCSIDGPMSRFYRAAIGLVNTVITPSAAMKSALSGWWAGAVSTIPDPYEVEPQEPRVCIASPWRALWFGAPANLSYLCSLLEDSSDAANISELHIVTNEVGRRLFIDWAQRSAQRNRIPRVIFYDWSVKNLEIAAKNSDIVLIPSDSNDQRKIGVSENRLVTALMLGLPAIATVMPSYRPYTPFFVALQPGWSDRLGDARAQRDSICRAQAEFQKCFDRRALELSWRDLLQVARLVRVSV